MLGSEGTLGVITGVTLSLRRRAERQAVTAFAAPDMRAGFSYQRELVQTGWRPPVMRQYDERESRRLHDQARDHTLIMVHEGPAALVEAEVAAATDLAARMGLQPLAGGHRRALARPPQQRARAGTSSSTAGIVADTVEISATWDRIAGIYDAAVAALHAIPGCLAGSAHSSHVYRSGLNLYFTFAIQPADPQKMEAAYFEAWRRIMTATAEGGGSLSHHHGIGRVRRDWLPHELGAEGVALLRRLKSALDRDAIMNPGVLLPDA
jgi:alkyldihydroxyacetonephosphate synthase